MTRRSKCGAHDVEAGNIELVKTLLLMKGKSIEHKGWVPFIHTSYSFLLRTY